MTAPGGAEVLAAVRAHLDSQLGVGAAEAAVTFLGVEPVTIRRHGPDGDGAVRYVTVGCSRAPMTDPTALVVDPLAGPRAELVVTLRGGEDGLVRSLAVLAAAPAVDGLVLVADALVDMGEPLWDGAAFSAVVLGEPELPDLELPDPAEPVRFLTAVPVTATEAAWVRVRGVPELRAAWEQAGIDPTDPARAAYASGTGS